MSEHAQATAGIRFLCQLEQKEAELLSWGMVDGFFSDDEIYDLAEEFLEQYSGESPFFDSDELIEWLGSRALLYAREAIGETPIWRTRMAESVRLLARLRQFFNEDGWRTGPKLVGDFRFKVSPRQFPRRHIPPARVVTELEDFCRISANQAAVLQALLGSLSERPLMLADFQLAAAKQVLSAVQTRRAGGTIVCAGTGSGKTLAFYLPAFVDIVSRLGGPGRVSCLALYPRIELLKDQFRTALSTLLQVQPELEAMGLRRISIGVFYGDVPHAPSSLTNPGSRFRKKWQDRQVRGETAFQCPFLDCPLCSQSLAWKLADIKGGTERLFCTACEYTVGPSEVRLTRRSIRKSPPDILFTTTEMINRKMCSEEFGHLFGVGCSPPEMVLIDEVHTYEGAHGAHVGLLLRRWKHLASAQPHFVGLSATLANASDFFARLVGVYPDQVIALEPTMEELEASGSEYLVVARGDPVSGASLLSTTIQSSMLLQRILDEPQSRISEGVYGSRLFAFTDNLDVANRLFHDLSEAEGFQQQRGSLASLRRPDLAPTAERWRNGQSWDLPSQIGHNLNPGSRAVIDRTTSQDSGVARRATAVVATASLEVGYDDPTVGAVIQHKAPMSSAAYVQRRGRAGRGRLMHPWTVIILSDFGRDKLAYQNYQELFSPQVRPQSLPIRNRYILRIHATYALLEWLGRGTPNSDPWSELSGSKDVSADKSKAYIRRLRDLLHEPASLQSFSRHLSAALNIESSAEVDALLWEHPRAVLMSAVPTLLRRIETGWKRMDSGVETQSNNLPLPDFLPSTLFSDLNLPELVVVTPAGSEHFMPLALALREYAPGRVSRRFAITDSRVSHWFEPTEQRSDCFIELTDTFEPQELQRLGRYSATWEDREIEVTVFRPYRLVVREIANDVLPSSNAFPIWHSQVEAPTGEPLELPVGHAWTELLVAGRVFSHGLGNPIKMRRFTSGSRTSLNISENRRTETFETTVTFRSGGERAALGFEIAVDAVCFTVNLPVDFWAICATDEILVRGLRPQFLRHRLESDVRLDGIANYFQRGWLAEAYLGAVILEAITTQLSPQAAYQAIVDGTAAVTPHQVLTVLFGSWVEDNHGVVERGRRLAEIQALLNNPDVRLVADDCVCALWLEPDGEWESWLRQRFLTTVGAALLGAFQRLSRELDTSDIYVDIAGSSCHTSSEERFAGEEIWLSEASPGGTGLVENIYRMYSEDPRRFFHFVEAELEASDREQVESQMATLLRWLDPESESFEPNVERCLRTVRASASHRDFQSGFAELRKQLSDLGLVVDHSVVSGISARLLRPGWVASTDLLVLRLLEKWEAEERRLGFDIGLVPFCFSRSENSEIDEALVHLGDLPPLAHRAAWRFSILVGMLWARGAEVRAQGLELYNPFQQSMKCDRRLVLSIKRRDIQSVDLDDCEWRVKVVQQLGERGIAVLSSEYASRRKVRTAILDLMLLPVDIGPILLYPRVSRIRREGAKLEVTLELAESIQ